MIVAIIIIGIALTYLIAYETEGLTIRLPYGKSSIMPCDDDTDDTVSLEVEDNDIPDTIVSFKPSEFTPLDIPELAGELNILAKVV